MGEQQSKRKNMVKFTGVNANSVQDGSPSKLDDWQTLTSRHFG